MSKHELGAAYFDVTETYRYALSRVWDEKKPMMLFIGLNPSTADATKLDPTLRRIVSFATREGCGGFWVGNLFAFRATNPREMLDAEDPIGPENNGWLLEMARWCSVIIAGWGALGHHLGREAEVRRLLQGHALGCLGVTKEGRPRHPLYLRGDAPLTVYQDQLWRPS